MDKNTTSHELATLIESLGGYGKDEDIPIVVCEAVCSFISASCSPSNFRVVHGKDGNKLNRRDVIVMGDYRVLVDKPYARVKLGTNNVWSLVIRKPEGFDEKNNDCLVLPKKSYKWKEATGVICAELKKSYTTESGMAQALAKIAGIARTIVKAVLDTQFVLRSSNTTHVDKPFQAQGDDNRKFRRFEGYTGKRTGPEGKAELARHENENTKVIWKSRPVQHKVSPDNPYLALGGNYPKHMRGILLGSFDINLKTMSEVYCLLMSGQTNTKRYRDLVGAIKRRSARLMMLVTPDGSIGELKNFLDRAEHAFLAEGVFNYMAPVQLPLRKKENFKTGLVNQINASLEGWDITQPSGQRQGFAVAFMLRLAGVITSDLSIIRECFDRDISYSDIIEDKPGTEIKKVIVGQANSGKYGPIFQLNSGTDVHGPKEARLEHLNHLREASTSTAIIDQVEEKINQSSNVVTLRFRDDKDEIKQKNITLTFQGLMNRTAEQEEKRNSARIIFRNSAEKARTSRVLPTIDPSVFLKSFNLPNCGYNIGGLVPIIKLKHETGVLEAWMNERPANKRAVEEVKKIVDGKTKTELEKYFKIRCKVDPDKKFPLAYEALLEYINVTAKGVVNDEGMDVVDGDVEEVGNFSVKRKVGAAQSTGSTIPTVPKVAKIVIRDYYRHDDFFLPKGSMIESYDSATYNIAIGLWNSGEFGKAMKLIADTCKGQGPDMFRDDLREKELEESGMDD